VTVGTVARGYAEAERRGLLSGQVGRGTFVRAGFGAARTGDGVADLASLHPPIADPVDPAALLGRTLAALAADPVALQAVADTEDSFDATAHREAAASWVRHGGFTPDPRHVLLTSGAQHALSVALMALVPRGSAVATTALTNPGLVAAARQLEVPLVAVAGDHDGMHPQALADACANADVAAVYLQPTLDNPLARTIPAVRRTQLADVCSRAGRWVIEDDPLAPLVPERPEPIAALLPDRTCHLASAAKVLALGLRVGVLSAPPPALPRLTSALRASTWLAAPLLGELLARWVQDGTARNVVEARIRATRARNAAVRDLLSTELVEGDPRAPHLWLPLPEPWSSGGFVNAGRAAGVLVSPGDDYLVDRTTPALGVRVGLNAELDDDTLRSALGTLVTTLRTGPSPAPLG
jgi:DNA-binding transcriptional MocR family regulator